jgi:L-alanine-DL-glutamate epimerase-like enolase superfamily enzyme
MPTASRPGASPLRLTLRPLELALARPWTIARGTSSSKTNALLELEAEGIVGLGEAAPNARYQQSYATVSAAFERIAAALEGRSPNDAAGCLEAAERATGDRAALAALDMALWDWRGRKLGKPAWDLLGIARAPIAPTSFSIGIDSPDVLREKVRDAGDIPILKIKLGAPEDEANFRAVRAATSKRIRVDANEGWRDRELAASRIEWLASEGVELIEQPLPAADLDGARWLAARSPVPLVADESAPTAREIEAIAGAFHGVNVKLAKCGGLTRAREAIAAARARGLRVMLGCMIESSLGIAAALQLAPLVDWIDLDGNLLLANDPFEGLAHNAGMWRLPTEPGLGVRARAGGP